MPHLLQFMIHVGGAHHPIIGRAHFQLMCSTGSHMCTTRLRHRRDNNPWGIPQFACYMQVTRDIQLMVGVVLCPGETMHPSPLRATNTVVVPC